MGRLRLRTSEWVLIGFFAYIVAVAPWFPERPHLGSKPIQILVIAVGLFSGLALGERTRYRPAIGVLRDWLPLLLTLTAFREMDLFLPQRFDNRLEASWIRWDRLILSGWHFQSAIESLGWFLPFYLELCYLLVYGLGPYCIGLLYQQKRRDVVDRFLTVYLIGTLSAYALFPYFPSQPPRILYPAVNLPNVTSWVRSLNLQILNAATIHVGVFPSAHVSSAFSAAWGMFHFIPNRKALAWGFLWYALNVSVATVYGRYHYTADVVAGFGVSLIAAALCLRWSMVQRRPHPAH